MRALAGAVLLLAAPLLSDAAGQNVTGSMIFSLRPSGVASASFLFDDCGERERGEVFRKNFLDAAALCARTPDNQETSREELQTAIERARAYHLAHPFTLRPGEQTCRDRRPELWSVLLDKEQKLDKWRLKSMTDEQIASEVCKPIVVRSP
jgi:hypothetical protein